MTTSMRPQATQLVPAGAWRVDPARSTVGFAIRHLMVATVHGRFTRFAGTIEHDAHGTRISGVVDAASAETGNGVRDERLRGPGFLDAAAHPEIRFAAHGVAPGRDRNLRIGGDLTIAGVTHPVRLTVGVDRHDDPGRLEVTARGWLRRSDFGIDAKSLLEAGVSDRVAVELDVSLVRDAPAASPDRGPREITSGSAAPRARRRPGARARRRGRTLG